MSELNIGRIEDDKETEKVRNITFLIAVIAIAIVPFIVYKTFVKTKTEIVFIETSCSDPLMEQKRKSKEQNAYY